MSFLSLCLLLHLFQANCWGPQLAPALYVLGDSMVDSGNNDALSTTAKVNYKPYSIDFPYDTSTGRFTNGKTSADFIAQFLGLPFAPPYMGLSVNQKSKITTGINYASGSAGILQETGSALGKNLPLKVQIEMFNETVTQYLPKNFKTNDEFLHYLSKSIFLVNVGSNDFLNNYLLPTQYNSSHQYSPEQFASLLLQELKQYLQKLYNLGARKFVVFNVGPLGCIPAIVKQENVKIGCAKRVNYFVSVYDKGFPSMIQELRDSLKDSTFVHGDINLLNSDLSIDTSLISEISRLTQLTHLNLFLDGISKIENFITASPCCSNLDNETNLCVKDSSPCMDRAIHVYWDGFHPTQVVYMMLSIGCFYAPLPCSPINVLQLAMK
ncbi:hypothetical protein NE237_009804 [Protea cynaroides]|uniref:Uncharacterized protein n=1 Tax=Protea cynaroides TaxID=273540 RepID=A0A9Q0KYL5_9MAGN|nr:hypothetical protein NE237_009804 [Protea cynaroides]